ncbi:hypothetical protein [Actinoplanes sp. NPDC051851]|uniref:hypothetical protein n=1 Tax=Actinoplanes sp. NPDC051851 TaxID=3154753 RepID=UPI003440F93B
MAIRSWVKLVATTATAAAVVGAGQLGIAYGLGMVRLDRALDITARDQWTAQLAWVAWMTMTAAAIGAIVATGMRSRWLPRPVSAAGSIGLGVTAGLGSLAVLPLTMQPARSAVVAGVQPVFVIGAAAGIGAAVGIFAAAAAAAKPVFRWNLAVMSVLTWIVALVTIGPSLLPGHTATAVRVGVLEGSLIPAAVAEHTPFLTMPVLALLAGLIVGWIGRGKGTSTLAVAFAGLPGAALLTMAYLIAGPAQDAAGFQLDPYWSAMTAAGAGVLGSVIAAIVRSAPATPGAKPGHDSPASTPEGPAGDSPASTPLPRRDAPVQSAIAQAAAAAAQRPEDQLRPSDTGVLPAPGTPNNPFSGGSGSPFRSGTPYPTQPEAAHTPPPVAPHTPPPAAEPRFSGQQPPAAPRRGRGDTTAFNGFTTGQPTGRAGAMTAEQPRVTAAHGPVVEPTSISGPFPQTAAADGMRGRGQSTETDYVDWVNGLGNA